MLLAIRNRIVLTAGVAALAILLAVAIAKNWEIRVVRTGSEVIEVGPPIGPPQVEPLPAPESQSAGQPVAPQSGNSGANVPPARHPRPASAGPVKLAPELNHAPAAAPAAQPRADPPPAKPDPPRLVLADPVLDQISGEEAYADLMTILKRAREERK